MASDPEAKNRRTTSVPVTTMEELPVLSEQEREDLLASLKEAEAQIKAGDYIEFDEASFKDRLLGLYRAAKR
jgi:hypothetical protein